MSRIIDDLSELARQNKGTDKEHAFNKQAYDVAVIAEFVATILDSETNLLAVCVGLHSIIDGDLDCDRLDYVVRDLFSAGIYRDTIQYQRLLSSYSLCFNDAAPRFIPSTRALSTIEDFFWQRLFLYRYVVFHHRVAKMDGLLREALAELGLRYILAQPPFAEGAGTIATVSAIVPADHLLPDISGLWRILALDADILKHLEAQFSQWDDSWLLSMLRRHYFCDRGDLPPNYKLSSTKFFRMRSATGRWLSVRIHFWISTQRF
jgi:HD superfamily phosphohydrolase